MKRKYTRRFLALGAALCLLLTGCLSGEAGDMFALPQPPEEYRNLNATISEIRATLGGESIAPQSGANTQTVQLLDLDGDGRQESAAAFFRVSGAEKPLKMVVFRLTADERYEVDTIIEGVGSSIASVAYENIAGSERKEVVVSWQISATDHTLGAYSLDDMEGIELLWVDSYTRFRLADLDQDGQKEAVVLQLQTGEEGITAQADYYDYDGSALALKSSAPISVGIKEFRGVRSGYLINGDPAVFVTSGFAESPDQVVDILACKDGVLTNITLDNTTLRSEETVRSYNAVSGTDLNRDGIMEVPQPILAPKAMGVTDDFWYLNWRQFDIAGRPHSVCVTFHNVTDGWYFTVPAEWTDGVAISRKDSTTADERAVMFSRWERNKEPEPFMILYKLTGTSQSSRATQGRRQVLFSDATATYAFELLPEVWDCGLTQEDIPQRFRMILTEWSTEN